MYATTERPRWPQRAGRYPASPLGSPWISTGPRPQRKSCKAQLSTPAPRLFRAASRCLHTADPLRQQCLAPSAPTARQLRGPRQEWPAIQGTPQATLSPRLRSTARSSRRTRGSLLQQAGHGPAGAGGREEVQRDPGWVLGLLSTSHPGSQANGAGFCHGAAPPPGSFLPLRGTPWCFQLLRKLHSPASSLWGGGAGWGGSGRSLRHPPRHGVVLLEVSRLETGTRGKKTKAAFKVTKPPRVLSTSQGARGPEGSARRLKGRSQEGEQGRKERRNPHWPAALHRGRQTCCEGGEGRGWPVALFGNLGSELLRRLQGPHGALLRAALTLSFTGLTACSLSYKKPFQKRGPNPAPGSLGSWGTVSSGPLPWGTSSLRGALRGDGAGEPSYRKSPAAKGSRLWLSSCHRQRSLEKGWSSVPWSSGKPS